MTWQFRWHCPQAYGLLNTLYYTCAFLFAWVYVAKVPAGQGMAAAAKAFAGKRARCARARAAGACMPCTLLPASCGSCASLQHVFIAGLSHSS